MWVILVALDQTSNSYLDILKKQCKQVLKSLITIWWWQLVERSQLRKDKEESLMFGVWVVNMKWGMKRHLCREIHLVRKISMDQWKRICMVKLFQCHLLRTQIFITANKKLNMITSTTIIKEIFQIKMRKIAVRFSIILIQTWIKFIPNKRKTYRLSQLVLEEWKDKMTHMVVNMLIQINKKSWIRDKKN